MVAHDGTTDPRVFLFNFNYAMINRNCDKAHMCMVVLDFLQGDLDHWFNELARNSILSFKDFIVALFN